jgi:HlyD family secretion protein
MRSPRFLISKKPLFLIGAPLCLMFILSITVLFPALKDPESKMYGSAIGYPAIKRRLGQPIKVDVASAKITSLTESIAASGESVALNEVTSGPQVGGTVQAIYIVEGQRVKKGQPLLKIDPTIFAEKVKQTENTLAVSQNNLRVLPQQQNEHLLELQANMANAKTQLEISENNLKQIAQRYQENLVKLQANLTTAEGKLKLAKTKLDQQQELKNSGALSASFIADTETIYLTRKNEYINAQQDLMIAKQSLIGDLNTEKKNYATQKKEVINTQQELARFLSNRTKELNTARLTVANNQIALTQAQRNLTYTTLYAATDGLVSRVNISPGEIATAQTPAITLTQDIVFKSYIDQAQINAVKIGSTATVRFIAYPGKTFQGQIIRLNPTVQTEINKVGKVGKDRQYTYSAWIAVQQLEMTPGLQGYAIFDTNKTSLLSIPETSVTHLSAGQGIVMVIENGKAVLKQVQLGKIFDNQREVIAGLKQGEEVVLSPRALNPGDQLKVRIASIKDNSKN